MPVAATTPLTVIPAAPIVAAVKATLPAATPKLIIRQECDPDGSTIPDVLGGIGATQPAPYVAYHWCVTVGRVTCGFDQLPTDNAATIQARMIAAGAQAAAEAARNL